VRRCGPGSGRGAEAVEDMKSLAWLERKAVETEGVTRLDHDVAGGVIVAAAATGCAGDARDMMAATRDDHDYAILGDAKPDGGLLEPRAGIDPGVALQAEQGVGVAARLGAIKLSNARRHVNHLV